MEKIRSFYDFIYFIIFLTYFKLYVFLAIPKGSKIIIFDIDNTIARTREDNNSNHVIEIAPNTNLCDASKRLNDLDSYVVLFMSVRPLSMLFKTKKWLDLNIKSTNRKKLFFVRTPNQKVKSILHILHNRSIVLIDDMSFDLNKEIFLFERVIQEINSSDISYLGLDFIERSYRMNFGDIYKEITELLQDSNS